MAKRLLVFQALSSMPLQGAPRSGLGHQDACECQGCEVLQFRCPDAVTFGIDVGETEKKKGREKERETEREREGERERQRKRKKKTKKREREREREKKNKMLLLRNCPVWLR